MSDSEKGRESWNPTLSTPNGNSMRPPAARHSTSVEHSGHLPLHDLDRAAAPATAPAVAAARLELAPAESHVDLASRCINVAVQGLPAAAGRTSRCSASPPGGRCAAPLPAPRKEWPDPERISGSRARRARGSTVKASTRCPRSPHRGCKSGQGEDERTSLHGVFDVVSIGAHPRTADGQAGWRRSRMTMDGFSAFARGKPRARRCEGRGKAAAQRVPHTSRLAEQPGKDVRQKPTATRGLVDRRVRQHVCQQTGSPVFA